jgi:hypothetical protein
MDITKEVDKRFDFNDVKQLTLFTDRLIPGPIKEKYPKYKLFIKYFLEYLDKGTSTTDGVFKLIVDLIKYFDLDYINNEMTETDENGDYVLEDGKRIFNELGDKLIYSFFETFVGSKESRYLSTFLDDVQFLKRQKKINQMKGTKNSFLFFFLLVLGGYFKILNLSETKNHGGMWKYDGTLLYTNADEDILEPYRYIVFSEFNPDTFSTILDTLNPAGMEPIFFIQKQLFIDLNQTGYNNTVDYYFEEDNIYFSLYDVDNNLLGLIKSYSNSGYRSLPITNETSDLETIDGRKWQYVITDYQFRTLDDSTGGNKDDYRNEIEMMFYSSIIDYETFNQNTEIYRIDLIQVNTIDVIETGLGNNENTYLPDQIDINNSDIDVLLSETLDNKLVVSDINEVSFILER